MSVAPGICGACGTVSTSDARFCGRCGGPIGREVAPAAAAPVSPKPANNQTMLGISLGDLGGAAPGAAATVIDEPPATGAEMAKTMFGASLEMSSSDAVAAPVGGAANRTMLGAMLELPSGWRPPAEVPAVEAAAGSSPDTQRDLPVQRGSRQPNRTMLGMPSVDLAALDAARAAVAPAAAPAVARAAPAVAPAAPAVAPAAAPAYAPAAAQPQATANPPRAQGPEAASEPAAKRDALGPSNRTMLGVAAPVLAQAQAAAAAANAARQAAAQQAASAASQPSSSVSARSSSEDAWGSQQGDVSIAGLPSPRKRGRGPLVAILVLGVLVMFAVLASLAWWRFGARESAIRASVAQTEEGDEVLELEVPGAIAGTRARFGGTEQTLEGARARFPLSAESLHVGDNPLSIDVVAPSGAIETHRVTLTLELRVRPDLTTLAAAEPAITVTVEALPGSTASLDGQALPLDAQGRGSRAFPIATMTSGADGVVQHVVRWTVQPSRGEAAEGTLTTRVPLTTIQIDRPGTEIVTDRDQVEIAGAVAPQSTVTIDGQPVTVTEGRFLHAYPMPAVGDFSPRIVAHAPGRAPSTRTITIHRVADLAREAASFEFDRTLTYARIAQSPAVYRGQRVAIEGRVYNVDVQGGRSVLQMLVRDCPSGQRCPLWITYPAATDVTVESWVRVLGTVAGEQQFRSESGQIRTVPRVDATYVLPARP